MFEAVRTYPGYGMATLIYNNLLNLILGTVMFLIIILYIGYLILKNVFIGSTAKNGFQIRIVQQKIHNIKENKALFYMPLKENITIILHM